VDFQNDSRIVVELVVEFQKDTAAPAMDFQKVDIVSYQALLCWLAKGSVAADASNENVPIGTWVLILTCWAIKEERSSLCYRPTMMRCHIRWSCPLSWGGG
jgi:hypothetical protein